MQDKPSGYYEGVNVSLLDSIPLDAEIVLEIGCGAGVLGGEYKKKNKTCTYYGAEIDPSAAALAAPRLDKVICGPVESADFSAISGNVDCIVYGDVLEHLIDPWEVLKSHRELLKEGGKVVASIPNIQHWSLLRHLLQGNWVYHDHGLLDRTHLRFFTLNSIYALFSGAGLKVENIIGLHVHQPSVSEFFEQMKPALANLGIDAGDFVQRCGALQYLVSASR
jgi:2-polyprenyl-3-methyl-5-hydroxy-6-metoxy-1,4-benzoquinol methylase